MSAFVIALVLASTFMHAGWNLLARRGRSEAECFWRMQVVVIVVGLLRTLPLFGILVGLGTWMMSIGVVVLTRFGSSTA